MERGGLAPLNVKIYTQLACQPCRLTKKKFDQLGIPYREVALDDDNLNYVRSLGYTAAPVIEIELGDGAEWHWSGYRPSEVERLQRLL